MRSRLWCGIGVLLLAFGTSRAQSAPDIDATLQRARDLIYTSGDYDGAVRLLREEVDWQRPPDDKLREAYLLLIDSIVYLGNARVADPGGYSTAQILYDEARLEAELRGSLAAL